MRVARLLGESSSAVVLPETAYVRTLYKQPGGNNITFNKNQADDRLHPATTVVQRAMSQPCAYLPRRTRTHTRIAHTPKPSAAALTSEQSPCSHRRPVSVLVHVTNNKDPQPPPRH